MKQKINLVWPNDGGCGWSHKSARDGYKCFCAKFLNEGPIRNVVGCL